MRLIIATLLAFIISSTVFATAPMENPPIVTLEKIGEKRFQLKYLEIPEGKVTVAFKDETNRIIYRDVIESDKVFFKNYDLKRLDLGTYQVQVFSDESGKLSDFDVFLGPESIEKSYFAKVTKLDNQSLAVVVKNLDETKMNLEIFDKGNLVYEAPITGEAFGKKFSFKNVASLNDITIKVSDRNGFGNYLSAR